MTEPLPFGAPRMPEPGTVLAGKYRVERQIGSGGMGVVLSAQHIELEVSVAVKLLSASAAIDPDHLLRFKREAKAAANIKSERVVRIIDYGTLDDRTPFIVMEQLEGASLVDMLESGERIAISDAVDYIIQACDGLNEAHRLGVIHRDIKPGNLFLVRRPSQLPLLKVLDFGAAKLAPNSLLASDGGSSTHPSSLIGSPRYMAPEQLKETSAIDHRVDVYALGASLFELLTGQPIFEGDTVAQIFSRVLYEPPPALHIFRPDISPELELVVMKCLQKRAADRYQSVAELARALAPFAPERSAPIVAALNEHETRPSKPNSGRARAVSAPALTEQISRASSSSRTVQLKARPLRLVIFAAVFAGLVGAALAVARARTAPPLEVRAPVQLVAPPAPSPVERVSEPPAPLPPPPPAPSLSAAPPAPERAMPPPTRTPQPRASAPIPPPPGKAATRPASSARTGEFDQFGGRL